MPDRIGFLSVPETTPEAQRLFDEDLADLGYVMNTSRLWAYQPGTVTGLFDLLRQANSGDKLTVRQRSILVSIPGCSTGHTPRTRY